jgi:hypothetical protein
LFSGPETTNTITSRSRDVSDAAFPQSLHLESRRASRLRSLALRTAFSNIVPERREELDGTHLHHSTVIGVA